MGHSITIVDKYGNIFPSYPRMSGNFNDLYRKYGGVLEIHGHSSKTVIRICDNILKKLYDEGIRLVEPGDGYDWWYGTGMNEKNRKEVYYRIIYFWRECAEKYDGYWYSDQVFTIEPYRDIDYKYDSDGKEDRDKDSYDDDVE